MKFLCAAIPEAGHVNPVLPIVRALAGAGHSVTVTTGADHAAAVTAAGARFVPLPEGTYWDPAVADERFPYRRELTGVRRLRFGLVHGFCAPAAAQAAPVLLSGGKTVTASSTESADYTPASAVADGNAGTRWASTPSDAQWLTIDLGGTAQVEQVVLT